MTSTEAILSAVQKWNIHIILLKQTGRHHLYTVNESIIIDSSFDSIKIGVTLVMEVKE